MIADILAQDQNREDCESIGADHSVERSRRLHVGGRRRGTMTRCLL